jgi:hypothetical protein
MDEGQEGLVEDLMGLAIDPLLANLLVALYHHKCIHQSSGPCMNCWLRVLDLVKLATSTGDQAWYYRIWWDHLFDEYGRFIRRIITGDDLRGDDFTVEEIEELMPVLLPPAFAIDWHFDYFYRCLQDFIEIAIWEGPNRDDDEPVLPFELDGTLFE